MLLATALLFAASTTAAPPSPPHRASATATVRARILAPAEVRRIDGRLVVRVGSGNAPTQVHQTKRPDGGQTADFY